MTQKYRQSDRFEASSEIVVTHIAVDTCYGMDDVITYSCDALHRDVMLHGVLFFGRLTDTFFE